MAFIPGGVFQMGDSYGGGEPHELPVHSVYVRGFYMDKYEVTKVLWDEVYNWATSNSYSFDHAGSCKAANIRCIPSVGTTAPSGATLVARWKGGHPATIWATGVAIGAPTATACRPRPSGEGPLAADSTASGMAGGIRLTTAKPTIGEIRFMLLVAIPTPARWVRLRRLDMACMIWKAMYGSGVRIGMTRILQLHPRRIPVGLRRVRAACIAATVGTTVPGTVGRRAGGNPSIARDGIGFRAVLPAK